jgi:hypothetical protein|tara:strand:+ start:2242 stop:2505 length:264 start_codon:yes stop_codon:yes gene_type:complete
MGELEEKAKRGDKKAVAKLKKQKDKLRRSDKFSEAINTKEDLTDEQKLKLTDRVGENIFTGNEVQLKKGGKVRGRGGLARRKRRGKA